MSDSTVSITAGTGTPIDVSTVTTTDGTVNRQRMNVSSPTTNTHVEVLSSAPTGSEGGLIVRPINPIEITTTFSLTATTGGSPTQFTALSILGRPAFGILVTSVGTGGACVVEGSIDGSSFVPFDVWDEANEKWLTATTNQITVAGSFWFEAVGPITQIRVRCTTAPSGGAITGTLIASYQYVGHGEAASSTGDPTPIVTMYVGGTDGTNLRGFTVDTSGNQFTRLAGAASATLTSSSTGVTSQTLFGSNAARKGAIVFNSATTNIYIAFGSTASTTSYTYKVLPGFTWEMSLLYTGIVTWIADAASGNVQATELS